MKELFTLNLRIVLTQVLLLIAVIGYAQSRNAGGAGARTSPWRLGLTIAPVSGWMQPTSAKSSDGLYRVKSDGSVLGYSWGLMADYFFTDNYAVATGFYLTNTGGHLVATSTKTSPGTGTRNLVELADFKYFLQYAEVPFNIKFRSDELASSRVHVFGQMGLTAGLNISKKATYRVVYLDDNGQRQQIGEDRERLTGGLSIAPLMIQLNIGGGAEFELTEKIAAYLGVFFNNGFFPDATNPGQFELSYSEKSEFSDGNVRLNNVAIRLGFFF